MLEAEATHRDHAIIEQVIAHLKDSPLAHLPSGRFTANATWLPCAIAHNLTFVACTLASTATPAPAPAPSAPSWPTLPAGSSASLTAWSYTYQRRWSWEQNLNELVPPRPARPPRHSGLTTAPRARSEITSGKAGQIGRSPTPGLHDTHTEINSKRRTIRAVDPG
jgi:hypothetical protein